MCSQGKMWLCSWRELGLERVEILSPLLVRARWCGVSSGSSAAGGAAAASAPVVLRTRWHPHSNSSRSWSNGAKFALDMLTHLMLKKFLQCAHSTMRERPLSSACRSASSRSPHRMQCLTSAAGTRLASISVLRLRLPSSPTGRGSELRRQRRRDKEGQRGTKRDKEGQRGTKRDKEGQRGTKRDKEGQRGTKRDKEGQRGTKRDKDGQRRTKTDKDGQRRTKTDKTERDKEGQRGTKRDKEGQRRTKRDKEGQRGTKRDKEGQRGTKKDKEGQRRTKTDKDGQRRTKTDKDGQRQQEFSRLQVSVTRCLSDFSLELVWTSGTSLFQSTAQRFESIGRDDLTLLDPKTGFMLTNRPWSGRSRIQER